MSRRLCSRGFGAAAFMLLSVSAPFVAGQTPVSLEVVTESGFSVDGQQQWLEFLKKIGFTDVRIRSARPGDQPLVTNRGSEASPRYAVTGLLTKDNQLQLPGLTVRAGQRKPLAEWLDRLREGGEDAVTGLAGAFGLTARQFVVLHDAVKPAITFSTKGKLVRDVVKKISESTPATVEMDATAETAIAGNEQVADELQGLSRGTALAAAVRPLGLVVVVTGQGKRVGGLRITQPAGKEERWPVGIGLTPATPPDKTAPSLFKFVNVEINDRPLAEALGALQERVQIPVLLDHNALAKHEVDMNAKVNFPAKKTFYKKIIDDLLYQAMLRSELRLDDADRPFLWITTIKK
jgi:hypothetical protein